MNSNVTGGSKSHTKAVATTNRESDRSAKYLATNILSGKNRGRADKIYKKLLDERKNAKLLSDTMDKQGEIVPLQFNKF